MNISIKYNNGTESFLELKKVGLNNLSKLMDDKLTLEDKAQLCISGDVKIGDLDPDSQIEVFDKGMELNEANMTRFMERQKKSLKAMTGMEMSELLSGKISGHS